MLRIRSNLSPLRMGRELGSKEKEQEEVTLRPANKFALNRDAHQYSADLLLPQFKNQRGLGLQSEFSKSELALEQ